MWSKTQHREFDKYIRFLLWEMDLDSWVIRLQLEPCEDGCHAVITTTFGQRDASLKICTDFFDREPDSARRTLVHELLHCHHSGAQHHSEQLHSLLGEVGYEAWHCGFRNMHEQAIDAVARAWSRRLPPPDWSGGTKYRAPTP